MKYNENIEIVNEQVERLEYRSVSLKLDEYFAVMVADYHPNPNFSYRPQSDYFDFPRSWIGLECLSGRCGGKKVYISKEFFKRHSPERGPTVVVRVQRPEECYILDD